MTVSKLEAARAQATKYYKQVETLKKTLGEQKSQKAFNRVKKRLDKTRKTVEKWRNKALKLDKLPNPEAKLPPVEYVEMEEYMGPLFTEKEVKKMTTEIEAEQEKLEEFIPFEEFQGNPKLASIKGRWGTKFIRTAASGVAQRPSILQKTVQAQLRRISPAGLLEGKNPLAFNKEFGIKGAWNLANLRAFEDWVPPSFKKAAKISKKMVEATKRAIAADKRALESNRKAALAKRELDITTDAVLRDETSPPHTAEERAQYKKDILDQQQATKVNNRAVKEVKRASKAAKVEQQALEEGEFKVMMDQRATMFDPMMGGTEEASGGVFEMTDVVPDREWTETTKQVTKLVARLETYLHSAEDLPHGAESMAVTNRKVDDILTEAAGKDDPVGYLEDAVKVEWREYLEDYELGDGEGMGEKWWSQEWGKNWGTPDTELLPKDFDGVRGYFEGNVEFSALPKLQQQIVNSVGYTDGEMEQVFKGDVGKMREYRTLVESELVSEGTVPLGRLRQWKEVRSGETAREPALERRPVEPVVDPLDPTGEELAAKFGRPRSQSAPLPNREALVEEARELIDSGQLDDLQTEVLTEYVEVAAEGATTPSLDRVAEAMVDVFPVSKFSDVEMAYIPTMPAPTDPETTEIRGSIDNLLEELGVPPVEPVVDAEKFPSATEQEYQEIMAEMRTLRGFTTNAAGEKVPNTEMGFERLESFTPEQRTQLFEIQERLDDWIDRNMFGKKPEVIDTRVREPLAAERVAPEVVVPEEARPMGLLPHEQFTEEQRNKFGGQDDWVAPEDQGIDENEAKILKWMNDMEAKTEAIYKPATEEAVVVRPAERIGDGRFPFEPAEGWESEKFAGYTPENQRALMKEVRGRMSPDDAAKFLWPEDLADETSVSPLAEKDYANMIGRALGEEIDPGAQVQNALRLWLDKVSTLNDPNLNESLDGLYQYADAVDEGIATGKLKGLADGLMQDIRKAHPDMELPWDMRHEIWDMVPEGFVHPGPNQPLYKSFKPGELDELDTLDAARQFNGQHMFEDQLRDVFYEDPAASTREMIMKLQDPQGKYPTWPEFVKGQQVSRAYEDAYGDAIMFWNHERMRAEGLEPPIEAIPGQTVMTDEMNTAWRDDMAQDNPLITSFSEKPVGPEVDTTNPWAKYRVKGSPEWEEAQRKGIAAGKEQKMSPSESKNTIEGVFEKMSPETKVGMLQSIADDIGGNVKNLIGIASDGKLFMNMTKSWGSAVKNWAMAQAKDVMMAPLVLPLTNWITSGMDESASNYFNLALSSLQLLRGDPTGVILATFGIGVGEMNIQHDRYVKDLKPDEVRGSKFGYIRKGNQWLPAVLAESYLDVGFGARNQRITMEYSADPNGKLLWIDDGTGTRKPYFTNPLQMSFMATEDEVEAQHQENYVGDTDMLRDWRFFDTKDQVEFISSMTDEDDYKWEPIDIPEEQTPFKAYLDDIRMGFEVSEEYRTKLAKSQVGDKYLMDYPSSQQFWGSLQVSDISRYEMRHRKTATMGFGDAQYATTGFNVRLPMWDNWDKDLTESEQMLYKDHPERYFLDNYESRVGDENFEDQPFKTELLDMVWKKSFENLIRSQKIAAVDAHFDDPARGYGMSDVEKADNKRLADWKVKNPSGSYPTLAEDPKKQTSWSRYYLDSAYDVETAQTWEGLQEQLNDVATYSDRSTAQQNFLAQKRINRFWMGKVLELGGGDAFMKNAMFDPYDVPFLHAPSFGGSSEQRVSMDNVPGMLFRAKGDRPDEKELEGRADYNPDRWYYDNGAGMIYPWANAGEAVIPDRYVSQLSDEWKPYYDMAKIDQDSYLASMEKKPQDILDANVPEGMRRKTDPKQTKSAESKQADATGLGLDKGDMVNVTGIGWISRKRYNELFAKYKEPGDTTIDDKKVAAGAEAENKTHTKKVWGRLTSKERHIVMTHDDDDPPFSAELQSKLMRLGLTGLGPKHGVEQGLWSTDARTTWGTSFVAAAGADKKKHKNWRKRFIDMFKEQNHPAPSHKPYDWMSEGQFQDWGPTWDLPEGGPWAPWRQPQTWEEVFQLLSAHPTWEPTQKWTPPVNSKIHEAMWAIKNAPRGHMETVSSGNGGFTEVYTSTPDDFDYSRKGAPRAYTGDTPDHVEKRWEKPKRSTYYGEGTAEDLKKERFGRYGQQGGEDGKRPGVWQPYAVPVDVGSADDPGKSPWTVEGRYGQWIGNKKDMLYAYRHPTPPAPAVQPPAVQPPVATPDPDVVPDPDKVPKQRFVPPYVPQTTSGMTNFQRYMYEEHGLTVGPGDVPANFAGMSFTASGEVALHGDPQLEKSLGLPENIRATRAMNGIVHQVFDPTVVEPKIIGTHEVANHQQHVTVI